MSKDVKLKKKHRFLATKIIVIFSTVFVIAPVATFMGLFYVADTKDVSKVEAQNIEDTLSKRLFKSISDLNEDTTQFTITFDDQTLDAVLMNVNKTLVEQTGAGNYLPKFYCTINDNKYNFYADLRTNLLKSRVEIATTLQSVKEQDIELKFTIDDIKLGRLSISKNLITNITSNFLSEDKINEALKASKFNAKFNFEDLSLTYNRSQFQVDVSNLLDEASKSLPEMNVVFNMIDKDAFSTTYKNGVSVNIDLDKFVKGVDLPEGEDLNLNLKETSKNVLSLVSNSKFDTSSVSSKLSEDEINAGLSLFVNYGYDKSSESIQTLIKNNEKNNKLIIDTLKLVNPDSLNAVVTDPTKYEGKINKTKILDKIIDDTEIQKFIAGLDPLTIPYTNITGFLYGFKIIGNPVSLALTIGDNKQNIYVAVNNFCIGVDEDKKPTIYAGIELNGLSMNLKITLNTEKMTIGSDGKLKIKISDDEYPITIGSKGVELSTVLDLIDMLNGKSDSFKFDENNKTFEINLGDGFSALGEKTVNAEFNEEGIKLTKNA